jgi:hypothetical protein
MSDLSVPGFEGRMAEWVKRPVSDEALENLAGVASDCNPGWAAAWIRRLVQNLRLAKRDAQTLAELRRRDVIAGIPRESGTLPPVFDPERLTRALYGAWACFGRLERQCRWIENEEGARAYAEARIEIERLVGARTAIGAALSPQPAEPTGAKTDAELPTDYELLRDAIDEHLSGCIEEDDVAEVAIYIDAIRRAGNELAALPIAVATADASYADDFSRLKAIAARALDNDGGKSGARAMRSALERICADITALLAHPAEPEAVKNAKPCCQWSGTPNCDHPVSGAEPETEPR